MALMEDIEREVIAVLLKANKGNKQRTAEALGIYKPVLYRKLRRYGLYEPKSKSGRVALTLNL